MKYLLLGLAVLSLSVVIGGCSVQKAVEPLPYFEVERNDGGAAGTEALCNLYKQYGFADANADCGDSAWTIKTFSEDELEDQRLIAARNALQHSILGAASSACKDFKDALVGGSTGRVIGVATLALLFSAGATVGTTDEITKGLAALAGASTGFGQIMEEKYSNDLPDALNGIEIARTRIFRQILGQETSSLLEYPVERAINDAIRYHNVCNLEEGRTEASSALSGAVEASRN